MTSPRVHPGEHPENGSIYCDTTCRTGVQGQGLGHRSAVLRYTPEAPPHRGRGLGTDGTGIRRHDAEGREHPRDV